MFLASIIDLITYLSIRFVVHICIRPFIYLFAYLFIVFSFFRMVGLRPGGFGIFIGILMFEALIAIALGLCISAAVPTVGK